MKHLLHVLSFLALLPVQGQLSLQPVQAEQMSARKVSLVLSLPFWDDFSTSDQVPDSNLWITGSDVFINATLAQNPPTYKVATFDGLRFTGQAHNIENAFSGPTDSLISQPIDLNAVAIANRNTVFLSFYWQAKGRGEIPDEKDSIRLQFRALQDTVLTWQTVWVKTGGPENVSEMFSQVIIPVTGNRFFHENFQFKFQCFSSQNGPFDTWHIDYVYLNDERDINDLVHFDRSLTGYPGPLFGLYREMPSEQFFQNPQKYLTNPSVTATNLGPVHNLVYGYELRNQTTGQLYIRNDSLSGGLIGEREFVEIGTLADSLPDELVERDSQVLVSTFHYKTGDGQPDNVESPIFELGNRLKSNDTIRTYLTLHNHYAYDDGTAEFAAAINTNRGQVALRFILEAPDTLTHIDVYFPDIVPQSAGATVDLIVWTRLDEEGELTRKSYQIQNPEGLNQFRRVQMSRPILVSDTIFIGYQQYTDNYIGVGFDRDNPLASGEIFTRVSGQWEQNTLLSGALMIRPVFDYDSTFILSRPASGPVSIHMYPNPTTGRLKIENKHLSIAVYDLLGHRVFSSTKQDEYSLHFLKNGIYLVKVFTENSVITRKLIISGSD